MDGTAVESAFMLLLTKVQNRRIRRRFLIIAIIGGNTNYVPYLARFLEGEVRSIMMRRTISGMIGAGSLAHNRRDFVAENVDPDRVHLNICYQNENLKEVYKELFDDAVGRYNIGKRKIGRLQITMKKSGRENRKNCSMK